MLNSEISPTQILIADDDETVRHLLKRVFEKEGYIAALASDGQSAMESVRDTTSLVILDLDMPKAHGLECLEFIKHHYPDTQVIVISGKDDIDSAVEAMRQGAFDYFNKPLNVDNVLARAEQAIKAAHLAQDNRQLREVVSAPVTNIDFVGQSAATQNVISQIQTVAPLDRAVLITGESGTGKTTLARMIHQMGPRAKEPFISVSCAALPRDLIEAELFGYERGAFTGAVSARPGRVEVADKGTLFLDEIGDLPLELQPKLLTFLQDHMVQRIGGTTQRKVDVRVISATHQKLEEMCQQKHFREDLYFRLNVLPIYVPPLRDRQEETIELANVLLERIAKRSANRKCILTHEAEDKLISHHWPGNVRELENVLERASAFCQNNILTAEDINIQNLQASRINSKSQATGSTLAGKTMQEIEKLAITETLRSCQGNKAKAARQLGISEKSIYNKMRRHELSFERDAYTDE